MVVKQYIFILDFCKGTKTREVVRFVDEVLTQCSGDGGFIKHLGL